MRMEFFGGIHGFYFEKYRAILTFLVLPLYLISYFCIKIPLV